MSNSNGGKGRGKIYGMNDNVTRDIIFEELFYHQHRVGIMAYCLSKIAGCHDSIKIFQGGWMHDEGKRRLDYQLLAKPEPLSLIERKIIEQHPVYSYRILCERSIQRDICKMVLHHHENFDGSGYPNKLSGDDIPIGSRIIRICDVYDALTNKREYRNGKYYTQEEAITIMESMKHFFDPGLFKCFKDNVNTLDKSQDGDFAEAINSTDYFSLSI